MSKIFRAPIVVSALFMSMPTQANEGEWELSAFRPLSVEMAVATDRKTGHKMQVVKLPNGTMMALVPATPLWDLMKNTPDNMLQ